MSQKSGHGNSKSQLGVDLIGLTLVDGQQLQIQTQLVQSSTAGSSNGRNAAVIGTTTGVGAAIGAAADGS